MHRDAGARGGGSDGRGTVTVVVPTHDRPRLLARTLRTVLDQGGVDLAVVVVDDAGAAPADDGAGALGDDRVRVIRHRRRAGVARARNTGLDVVDTPWVAFVDDDDVWAPDKLRSQLAALAAVPGAGWSPVGAVHVDGAGRVVGGQAPPPGHDLAPEVLRANVVPGGGSGVVARTELVRDVGGFDPALANLADWDLSIRLALRSPCAPVRRPLVGYLMAPTGMAQDTDRGRAELARVEEAYAAERRAYGVSIDTVRWLTYFALLADQAGRRGQSTRLHAELVWRHGHLRSVGSLVLNALPRAVLAARLRSAGRSLPDGWTADELRWLTAVPPADAGAPATPPGGGFSGHVEARPSAPTSPPRGAHPGGPTMGVTA